MLTNVQVVAGTTAVARFDDVVMWFETGPAGGGTLLAQLLQPVQEVASGSLAPAQLGARLAAVLNHGDPGAVPAMVVATPEDDGLRVVVHGWGAVVADGIHLPNGWADQVIEGRRTFFAGRNTVTPVAPLESSPIDLEDGIVPGDGVSFALPLRSPARPLAATPAPPSQPEAAAVAAAPPAPVDAPAAAEPPAYEPPPSGPSDEPGPEPAAWAPPGGEPQAGPRPAAPPPVPTPSPSPPPPGRLVLDDGSSARLERTCVLGSAPHGSPAVQTGVATPLTVQGAGVAPVHVEVRVEGTSVSVRDLGAAATFVLAPGSTTWAPLAPGQISAISPGTRVALGQRTFAYEAP